MYTGKHNGYHYSFGLFNVKKPVKDYLSIDPKAVYGPIHVLSSILTAIDAIKSGDAVARDVQIEFLVRLTGTRQISKALSARKEKGKVLLVHIGKKKLTIPNVNELELKHRKGELDAVERRLLIS